MDEFITNATVTEVSNKNEVDGTLYAVFYQILLAFSIVGGFAVGYELLRQSKFGKYIYAPRLLLLPDQTPDVANGWFCWFNKNKKINEDFILTNNGLDAVMVLKLYRTGYEMFFYIGVFVILFTLPVNIFYRDRNSTIADNNSTGVFTLDDIKNRNIPQINVTDFPIVNTNTNTNETEINNNGTESINVTLPGPGALKMIRFGNMIYDTFFSKREYQVDVNMDNYDLNNEEDRKEFFDEEMEILDHIKETKFQNDNNSINATDINALNDTDINNSSNNTQNNNTKINVEDDEENLTHTNTTVIEDIKHEMQKFDIRKYIFFDKMEKGREKFSIFHLVAIYYVIGVICYKLFRLYQEYLMAMEMYVKDSGIVQERNLFGEILQHSSIMVRNIPSELQDDERLLNWFSKLGIGKIENVVIARSRNKIGRLVEERAKVLNTLESKYVVWLNNIKSKNCNNEGIFGEIIKKIVKDDSDDIGEKPFEENDIYRPKQVVFKYGIIPVRYVDAIHYNEKRLLDLTVQIKELRLEAQESKKWSQTAFITFSNHQSAKIAAQLILYSSENPNVMSASTAPHPNDLIYKNLNIRTEVKTYRSLLIYVAMYLTCFILFIVVSATKYQTLENLTEYYFESLHMEEIYKNTIGKIFFKIDNSPQLKALFESFFQVLLLNTFTSCVPYILKFLSNFQGFETKSYYYNSILKKYYVFLFFTIILAVSFSSLVNQVLDSKTQDIKTDEVLKLTNSLSETYMYIDFNTFIYKLTQELTNNSIMYLNYGILRLQSFGFEIFRIGAVASFFLGKLLKKENPRAKHVAKVTATPPDYSIMLAVPLICLTIFITFSIVNPFIPWIGVIFFFLGYHVMKNQFIYVYIKDYESQGHYFITAFNRIIFSLFLFEIFMFGYFLAIFKDCDVNQKFLKIIPCHTIPYFILPSLIITYYFYNYCRKCFKPRVDNVPVDLLISKERERKYSNRFQRKTIFGRNESFVSDFYSEDSFISCATHVTTLDSKSNHEILRLSEEQAPDLPPYYEANSYSNPALTETLYSPWIPDEAEEVFTEAVIDNIANICKVCYY